MFEEIPPLAYRRCMLVPPWTPSVWWSWTAPASGGATLSTDGSDFDTTVSVYTGTSLVNLRLLNADDNSGEGPRSKLAFNATEGVTYQIAVAGFSDGTKPASEGN